MRSLALLLRYYRAEWALHRNAIAEYEAGIDYETPEFTRLHATAMSAENTIPHWLIWLRPLIGRLIIRRLDYWRRTGQK